MCNKLLWGLLLSIFALIPHHVHGQSTDAPEFFQSLTCLTHNLETLVCSWTISNPTENGIEYKVCYESSKMNNCFNTNERRFEAEFQLYSTCEIKITATNVKGTPEKRFQKNVQDIPFIPYTPQIVSLISNGESDTLYVEWDVNTSSFFNGTLVDWEVQILRSENYDIVTTELLKTHWSLSDDLFRWSWTSDIPLTCTSHSVRVRCFVNEYYDNIHWSEWSLIQTVYGSQNSGVFPGNKVMTVGSNVTFCCVSEEENITLFMFESLNPETIHLSKNSSAFRVYNLNKSRESGYNVYCLANNNGLGTVVFVGYPPDRPQNFSCETRDLSEIICSWNPGRSTGLYADRETIYTLHESYSGINISCQACAEDIDPMECNVDIATYDCKFAMPKGQTLFHFSLNASNPLGKSDTSLAFNATERIYPKSPENINIQDVTPREVSISFYLPGKFASIKLSCEVEIGKAAEEIEMRRFNLSGLDYGNYTASIVRLHPFKGYEFRVRCVALDHFWKWSEWTAWKKHTTLAAVPSRKPDVWRKISESPKERTITVYWKHLTTNEANGVVYSYQVSWKPLKSNEDPKYAILPVTLNRTQISLDTTDKMDYEITVVANSTCGLSPSSRITSAELPSDADTVKAVGTPEGMNITWQFDASVSCGYVIEWRPSSQKLSSRVMWKHVSSSSTSIFIKSEHLDAGLKYNISVYGCKENKYQLLKNVIGYTQELSPKVAPNFTVEETTSNSVQVRWEEIPDDDLQGFLEGYLVYVVKQESNSSGVGFKDLVGHTETKVKNITDLSKRLLKIQDLQPGTSYHLGLQAYTGGGKGPIKSLNVVTNDNPIGLILAILIPISVAVVLGIVISTICYKKREWIKETFYPDIPNPENSKALQFQKSINEGNNTIKTLEMNPCTPNSVEVVETLSTVPKIIDTELHSPITEDQLAEEDLDSENDGHIVVSYCPSAVNEDRSNSALEGSVVSSQVDYIDIQSMYQPQANSEEEPDNDSLDMAGYKPQMQLPISTMNIDTCIPTEVFEASAGYRPQENPNAWAEESPGSSPSVESEIASFGSPCSITSRHFLIPPADEKDSSLKPTHIGWTLTSIFQNKQDD